MSRFILATDLSIHTTPAQSLYDAFYMKYGARAWNEESEAASTGRNAMNRALERAQLNIQRLYELTGNLAVVGDGLRLSFPSDPAEYRLRIVQRNIFNDAEFDYIMVCYVLDADETYCPELNSKNSKPSGDYIGFPGPRGSL